MTIFQKRAFTLVELIVVITILVILGTIAFLSLSWYSTDAKNSKVVSDIGTISSNINYNLVRSELPLSWYLLWWSSTIWINSVSGNIWSGVTLSPAIYDIWNIDYRILRSSTNMVDPLQREYIYSYAVDDKWQYYQVAGEVQQSSWFNQVFIQGNYTVENAGLFIPGLISASGSSAPIRNWDTLTGSLSLY